MLSTAFLMGLAGSLHCAGMCSPLAFAVTNVSKAVWLNRLLYNAGRILTYGFLGAFVSTIGVALPFEKFQMGLSVFMGIVLIVVAFLGIGKARFRLVNDLINQGTSWLKMLFSKQIPTKSILSTFLLGMLNGMLPCGLSLVALTACLIAPSSSVGFYFMLIFGVGTLPVMLGFTSVAQFLIKRFSLSYSRLNTALLILAGSLLIARAYWPHNHQAITHPSGQVVVCEE